VTLTDLVANTLRVCRERGEVLTVGAVYSVARDVLCARVGMCGGGSHPYSGEPAGVLRVEVRDGQSPGEALLYAVDAQGRRVMRFEVLAVCDLEARETLEEVFAEFAKQLMRAANAAA